MLRGFYAALLFGLAFLIGGLPTEPRQTPAPSPTAFYPPPDPPPVVEMPTLPAPPDAQPEAPLPAPPDPQPEAEAQKEPKAVDEPCWIVLKMSEDDYESRHSEANRYTREARWHYGDCLMQWAHYRLKRRFSAKLRRLRRLEKALDDWGQAYCEKTCIGPSAGGSVYSVAHLECGRAIDRIVQSYRYPKSCPGGASELRKATQQLVQECARLNKGPDELERPNIPQKVTRSLLRETSHLTGETAQAAAKYMTATLNDVIE